MKLFQQRSEIQTYEKVETFAEAFSIGENDFILATESIYEEYFKRINLKAKVFYKNAYGKGEPTTTMIDQLLADFRKTKCNRIIAVGGGAVIDMAKVLVLDGSYSAEEIFMRKVPLKKVRTLIAVPTTCGAGSEVSNISIAEIETLHTKLGLASDEIYPDYAVLIPELLTQLPYKFFAASAIDALIHALESFVSPRANLYTRMFSQKAVEMSIKAFQKIAKEGEEARNKCLEDFLIASNLAGIGFGNAGTGAVHAMSYPLSGVYHVAHGEANYQFLTTVFKEYQHLDSGGILKELNQVLSSRLNCKIENTYVELECLLEKIMKRNPLRIYGMKEEEINKFASSVEQTQQRLLNQSYIRLNAEQMEKIYRKLY